MQKLYRNKMHTIQNDVHAISVTGSVDWYRRFALFSTNLGLMLPDIPFIEHEKLFKKTLINQRLSFLDEEFHQTIPLFWRADRKLDMKHLLAYPAIIATFHTGSYRLISYLLMQSNVPIALLLSHDVKRLQGQAILERAEHLGGRHRCRLVEAEKPTAPFQLMRAVKEGYTVLAYLDGNTGSGMPLINKNLVTINFLNGRLRARQGLFFLANKLKVPLYGIISRRLPEVGVELWFNREYQPGESMLESSYRTGAVHQLYSDLGQEIRKEPWQWDHWFFLHESLA